MSKLLFRFLIPFILFMVMAGGAGYAYNWENDDLKVLETQKTGDRTNLTLRDKEQHVFWVSYPENQLPDDVARLIVKYKNDFFSWGNLEIQELKFVLSLDILEIIILPGKIIHNGNNIVSAIPAGIVFIHDPAQSWGDGLQYDFKILKDNLITRVTGKYTTETEFNKHLFRVYDNPKAYLSAPRNGSIAPTGFVEPTPTPRWTPTGKPTKRPTAPPAGGLNPTGDAGSTGLTGAEFDFLLEKIIQLQVENERLRYALLTLENKGVLDEVRPISREVIIKVISLKRQYPILTFGELFDQLKKDGVRITKQELFLILAVYFNEFNVQDL